MVYETNIAMKEGKKEIGKRRVDQWRLSPHKIYFEKSHRGELRVQSNFEEWLGIESEIVLQENFYRSADHQPTFFSSNIFLHKTRQWILKWLHISKKHDIFSSLQWCLRWDIYWDSWEDFSGWGCFSSSHWECCILRMHISLGSFSSSLYHWVYLNKVNFLNWFERVSGIFNKESHKCSCIIFLCSRWWFWVR